MIINRDTFCGINSITITEKFFSPIYCKICEKEEVIIKNDKIIYKRFCNGNFNKAENKIIVKQKVSPVVIGLIKDSIMKDGVSVGLIDDCCGEVKICFNDGKTVIVSRGTTTSDGKSIYFILRTYLLNEFGFFNRNENEEYGPGYRNYLLCESVYFRRSQMLISNERMHNLINNYKIDDNAEWSMIHYDNHFAIYNNSNGKCIFDAYYNMLTPYDTNDENSKTNFGAVIIGFIFNKEIYSKLGCNENYFDLVYDLLTAKL